MNHVKADVYIISTYLYTYRYVTIGETVSSVLKSSIVESSEDVCIKSYIPIVNSMGVSIMV